MKEKQCLEISTQHYPFLWSLSHNLSLYVWIKSIIDILILLHLLICWSGCLVIVSPKLRIKLWKKKLWWANMELSALLVLSNMGNCVVVTVVSSGWPSSYYSFHHNKEQSIKLLISDPSRCRTALHIRIPNLTCILILRSWY